MKLVPEEGTDSACMHGSMGSEGMGSVGGDTTITRVLLSPSPSCSGCGHSSG